MARRCSRAFYVEACFRKFFVIIFKVKSHYIQKFTKFGLNRLSNLTPRSAQVYSRCLKRVLDFCCALAAILALSPLLLVLTVLGAVKMHGNPFFTQPRPGLNEKIFKLVKFRTMSNERDAQGNLLPDDVRLNAYGKFLRSTSLDFFLLGGPALR